MASCGIMWHHVASCGIMGCVSLLNVIFIEFKTAKICEAPERVTVRIAIRSRVRVRLGLGKVTVSMRA